MKVRIKLAINTEGQWCAYGWAGMKDNDPNDILYESVPAEGCIMDHWIIAEVPVPDATEIEATISKDGQS